MTRSRALRANPGEWQRAPLQVATARTGPTELEVRSERSDHGGVVVIAMLVVSATFVGVAPALMPAGYSWRKHGISESAAQGVDGAWMGRMAFLLFGLAVIWLAKRRAVEWQLAGRTLHLVFGLCMLAVAAFSTKPWLHDAAYVRSEDILHSVFASTMGFAFIAGTVSASFVRTLRPRRSAAIDLLTALSTMGLSIGMGVFPGVQGLLQRLMFGVAYSWYCREALASVRRHQRGGQSTKSPGQSGGPVGLEPTTERL